MMDNKNPLFARQVSVAMRPVQQTTDFVQPIYHYKIDQHFSWSHKKMTKVEPANTAEPAFIIVLNRSATTLAHCIELSQGSPFSIFKLCKDRTLLSYTTPNR